MKLTKPMIVLISLGLALTGFVSAIGLFDSSQGSSITYRNPYGDSVVLAGTGLYAWDSAFKAPIFRGTDLVVLFIVCPLLALALGLAARRLTMRRHLLLDAILAVTLYYSASLAFGVTFNRLHLAYIALFSTSLFAFISLTWQLASRPLVVAMMQGAHSRLPYRGFYGFLVLSGLALIGAWLPDILAAHAAGRPLSLIENYTTEITYVLDMGIIGPAALLSAYLIKQRSSIGFMILGQLLMLCTIIGIMLPVQSLFQAQAGIVLPLPVLVTKVATFVILAIFSTYFLIRLLRAIPDAAA
ncbi:MAG: hypothetical protein EOM08_03890 [Clostridia bacterium]|nr:hypothetical protein [Clostridia bacterium]NCC75560.1 hypothetical protein [Clostridia bacterium]